ncbi:aspartate--tRNA ligase [Candidatus Cytomitobacter indipagum]|uniref:Aspartate--tRNA(Asp/Asn) ligase n=1 Tax=Candidatus Cytomitobacter indipagum TaxID=2601575 RepID=A0A5C0UFZ5_9PROT|nr:aspartate--tRNA ligase [Candidatus Cytomitobacter indipagum]QEK37964.1 aspartate--tRNA ligase [Candidatus Cytomitobacter indipagum]
MSKKQYRSNYCMDLNSDYIDKEVKLAGWIRKKRDHGNMIFIDLKDHTGVVQCVIDTKNENFENINQLSVESVISLEGKVIARPSDSINDGLESGKVEIDIKKITILSKAQTLPFAMHQDDLGEELRLKYRFLDLRRDEMQYRLKLRSDVIKEIREIMEEKGFMEVHTPILTSSSPEGARDYVVPSRLNPGKFYALPQAPQQFKQLLMVSGVSKYYQIAPCFRDEDTRADRAPGAFYQLDMEMAFATQEEVFEVIEDVMFSVFSKFRSDMEISNKPFVKIPYKEAILKYGSDKPDLRIPFHYHDITHLFAENCPKIFKSIVEGGGKILMLPVKGLSNQTRKFFDSMQKFAQDHGAFGLGYMLVGEGKSGPLAKILSDEVSNVVREKADGAFFIADYEVNLPKYAGPVLKKVAEEMNLINKDKYEFCWIIDYPMYEINEGKWDFSHNPFSMPQGEMNAFEKDPGEIMAYQYDLVCNGIELTSGAIRNHDPEIMYKAFEVAGYSKEDVDREFGAMINAFKYGAPPHGGSAPGIDRMIMLLADTENIREIIPFPLNQQGQDLMMNAPCEISNKHLKELGIKIEE